MFLKRSFVHNLAVCMVFGTHQFCDAIWVICAIGQKFSNVLT